MTLGALRDALARCHPDADLCVKPLRGLYYAGIASWRGIYAEPAIGYSTEGYADNECAVRRTVAYAIADIDATLAGRVHHGWKGGEFRYRRGETAHVDNPGQCGDAVVVDVERGDEYTAWLVVEVSR